MAETLPPLRLELDIMPSPVEERPGLLVRDPYHYSAAMIIIPPLLARALVMFDGEHTDLDLREYLTRATGELDVSDTARHLIRTLDECGFLQTPTYFEMRDEKHREFAAAPERKPAHAGSAYPTSADQLGARFTEYGLDPVTLGSTDGSLAAIAAPHVSPDGGYASYAAAYSRLAAEHASKTFIILGTSHYGEPERFGLTRKPYQTPLGPVETHRTIVDRLAALAPDSIEMEDYCHASEHSIEFQSVFLQYSLARALPEGERLRAVPILCGSFFDSLVSGKPPETDDKVRAFFDALAEIASLRDDLVWVLGVDMAHQGRRYGDSFEAQADDGEMVEVRRRDHERLERLCAGDAAGFFELVQQNEDDLRWCGYAPLYTFLKTAPGLRGEVLSYEQWNIDDHSVVSFAGAEFRRG